MRNKTPIGRIVLAYLAACLTLPFVFFIVPGLLAVGSAVIDGPPIPSYSAGNTLGVMLIFAFTAVVGVIVLTALPSAILIYVAERRQFRAWWTYALGAVLIAVLVYAFLPWIIPKSGDTPYSVGGNIVFAALAVVPGTVYWFIAIYRRVEQSAPPDA